MSAVREENVGRFEIAVDYALGLKLEVPSDDMGHEGMSLRMREATLDAGTEIGRAEFGDDVGVVAGGVDIAEMEDMGAVAQVLQDLYLRVEQLTIDVVFEHLEVDHLHRYMLLCIPHSLPVSSWRPRYTREE